MSDTRSIKIHPPKDFDGTITRLMTSQGDLRDAGMAQKWKGRVRRMWAEQRQGANAPEGMPPYGQPVALGGRSWRERLSNA